MSALALQHHHTLGSATGRTLLAHLRGLLLTGPPESPTSYDGWLAARGAGVLRERDALLARLGALEGRHRRSLAARELERLVIDVEHHLQRRRDLAWDEVELELGGSE